MKRKNKNFEKAILDSHTQALEDNSRSIVEILEVLSNSPLSASNKKALGKIKRELKDIDKKLDNLGKEENREDNWFEF